MAQIIDFKQEKFKRGLFSLFTAEEETRLFWCIDERRPVPFSLYDRLLHYFMNSGMLPIYILSKTKLDIEFYVLDKTYEIMCWKHVKQEHDELGY